VNIYLGSVCGLVGQLGHCEGIHLEFVCVGRTGRAL